MSRKLFLPGIVLVFALNLAACDLYFGNDGGDTWNYCNDAGDCFTCQGDVCWPDNGTGPGWSCETSNDCAPGCYCASGVCEEGGFCNANTDCPNGFVCDDRNSCVPDGTNTGCASNDECNWGQYCDPTLQQCIDSPTCTSNTDCDPGFECDPRGTCVPSGCETSADCQEGCYCDTNGNCIETGMCGANGECPVGMECDGRNTCVPCPNGNCTPPTCSVNSDCADGQVCDTSGTDPFCRDRTCAEQPDEASCNAASCQPVYNGINCTNPVTGEACVDGDSGCVCQSFEYAACTDAATP